MLTKSIMQVSDYEVYLMDNFPKTSINGEENHRFLVLIEELFDQNDILDVLGKEPSSNLERENNSKLIMQRTFTKRFFSNNIEEAIILAEKWCKNQKDKNYTVFNTKYGGRK